MPLTGWLEKNIVMLGVVLIAGIGIYLALFFILKNLAKKLLSPEQYKRMKHQPVAWVTPILLAVMVIALQISVAMHYLDSNIDIMLKNAGEWFTGKGVVILAIMLAAFMIVKLAGFILPSAITNMIEARGNGKVVKTEVKKRSGTLSEFFLHLISGIVWLIAVFMVLSELDINIAPLLAGAGIVGIAVGLGAQKLISDLINGAFIMLEDYYSEGDVVQVAGVSGLVEDVSIRRTVLRDLDGIVHIIPNSEIKTASNYTRNWSRVNINIPVSYNEDLDHVIDVLNRVGNELAQDELFRSMIKTPPQVLRVDAFADSAIEIKMLGETMPIKQWEVTGELRKRVKKAFDEEGIEIPWPHMKVYFGDGSGHTVQSKQAVGKNSGKIDTEPDNPVLPPDDA